jgi:hypothetical protein
VSFCVTNRGIVGGGGGGMAGPGSRVQGAEKGSIMTTLNNNICVISGLRRDVDEMHSSGTLEYGTDRLSRNVGTKLPLNAA